jgi:hypothetical protein
MLHSPPVFTFLGDEVWWRRVGGLRQGWVDDESASDGGMEIYNKNGQLNRYS